MAVGVDARVLNKQHAHGQGVFRHPRSGSQYVVDAALLTSEYQTLAAHGWGPSICQSRCPLMEVVSGNRSGRPAIPKSAGQNYSELFHAHQVAGYCAALPTPSGPRPK